MLIIVIINILSMQSAIKIRIQFYAIKYIMIIK